MAKEGSINSKYAKVRRETLAACFTCPICDHLFSHPTTITVCLHTFCEKCIYDEIINEKCHHCPKCNTYIGVNPLAKLRSDNHINELRNAIFNQQGKTKNKEVVINQREENKKAPIADKVSSSLPPPPERIEESFSSRALGAPRVPTAAMIRTRKRSMSGRKRRANASQGPTFGCNEPSKRSGDSPMRACSPKHNDNLENSNPQSASKQGKTPEPSKGSKESTGSTEANSSSKSPIPVKARAAGNELPNFDLNKLPPPSPPTSPVKLPVSASTTTSERSIRTRRQLEKATLDHASTAILGDSDNSVKNISGHRRSIPLWFSLVPEKRPGVTPLPEISPYIKVEYDPFILPNSDLGS